jgi:hypothetical protein
MMPCQITISDRDRSILSQAVQMPSISVQQVELLVHELINKLWLMQELMRHLRLAMQTEDLPSQHDPANYSH